MRQNLPLGKQGCCASQIKKPRRVAQAGFLGFNRQLTCASVGLERVVHTNGVCSNFCISGSAVIQSNFLHATVQHGAL